MHLRNYSDYLAFAPLNFCPPPSPFHSISLSSICLQCFSTHWWSYRYPPFESTMKPIYSYIPGYLAFHIHRKMFIRRVCSMCLCVCPVCYRCSKSGTFTIFNSFRCYVRSALCAMVYRVRLLLINPIESSNCRTTATTQQQSSRRICGFEIQFWIALDCRIDITPAVELVV